MSNISKIIFYGSTLIDLSNDNIDSSKVFNNYKFFDNTGELKTGDLEDYGKYYIGMDIFNSNDNTLLNYSYAFYNSNSFNYSVLLKGNITNMVSMFGYCNNYNKPIILIGPFNNCSCSNLFYSCSNFNQSVNLPDGIINCSDMFVGCANMNQEVIIPNSVNNCSNMFTSCINMYAGYSANRNNIYIPDNCNCTNMFRYCTYMQYANKIHFGNNCNIIQTFSNCNSMYLPPIFGNGCYMGEPFSNMPYFDPPIKSLNIPDNCNVHRLFGDNVPNFNKDIVFGNDCYLVGEAFTIYNNSLVNFKNRNVKFGNNCKRHPTIAIFSGFYHAGCNVIFGDNCDIKNAFNRCGSWGDSTNYYLIIGNCNVNNFYSNGIGTGGQRFSNIYIRGTYINTFKYMFWDRSSVNIYYFNVDQIRSENTFAKSLSWTAITNGYYNSLYNIYLYNNIPKWVYNV